jgi:hypothetical protein
MTITRLLATLEEYFSMKRELGESGQLEELKEASKRVELSLREYVRAHFDRAIMEDRRKTSSLTRKVDIISPDKATYSWNDVVKLLDALNSAPIPPRNLDDAEGLANWIAVYKEWFRNKRNVSLTPINQELSIDFEELKAK